MNNKRKIEDEIKFRELLKNPIRLFGWVFLYFFVLLVILGIFFAKQLITIPFNQQVISLPKLENIKQDINEQKGGLTPAVDLSSIKNPTPEMINKGKELYDANCQSCHGATGFGDGPAGVMLNPNARNLHQIDGWTNGRTIDMLYKTLEEGIIKNGMAAYEYLSPSDRLDIIHYIRTFTSFPEITDAQITSMNQQYNLTEGVVKANKIPINKAINLIVEENINDIKKIIDAKSRIDQKKNSEIGARLISTFTYDLNKVISSFMAANGISLDTYIKSVNESPISKGYKPAISQLNKAEWKAIYDLLKQLTI